MTTTSAVGTVAVPGGDLAYEMLAGTSEPILAIHGISSHRRLWSWLDAEAPDLTLVTPDLRGRAESVDVTGPYDLARHADDMAALLDALDLKTVPVVGMSMGGFVALELRHRHPERVASLTLVDGGFPPLTAAGTHPGQRRARLCRPDRPARPARPALGERRRIPRVLLLDHRRAARPGRPATAPLRRARPARRPGPALPRGLVSDGRDIFFGHVPCRRSSSRSAGFTCSGAWVRTRRRCTRRKPSNGMRRSALRSSLSRVSTTPGPS
ncbi:MAG: alpha/beta hydrolase [Lapillicoccus sp.]